MKRSALLVFGVYLLLYIIPLGVRPLIIPDESRYAEIPREMIETGDWVVPRLDGIRYFEKPVLGYWLNAASIKIFGENAFAVRLPSALAAGLSALMVFMLVVRFGGGYSNGMLASLILLTSLEVLGIGVFSVLDTIFSMFVTGAMTSFFFAHTAERAANRKALLALFGAFCGLAFLTKGFIGFAVPAAAVAPFLIWQRRWRDLYRIPWLPLASAIAVALPWAVMIHLREPDFWHYFFWIEHIKRFMSDHPQHPFPFWFFIPVVIGGALPWTALLPAAIPSVVKEQGRNPLVRFAVCWFLFPFLFFSASHGKLGTYILPCYMPLAILTSMGLLRYFKDGKEKAFRRGTVSLLAFVGVLAATLAISQTSLVPGQKLFQPQETWKWTLGVAGLLVWGMLALSSLKANGARKKIALYAAAPLIFLFSAHFAIPTQPRSGKAPGDFLLRHADRIRPDSTIVSDRKLVRAVCWFYKRSDVFLYVKSGELAYGLSYPDSKHRLLSADQFKHLVAKGAKGRIVLIAKTTHFRKFRNLIPEPIYLDTDSGFTFAQF